MAKTRYIVHDEPKPNPVIKFVVKAVSAFLKIVAVLSGFLFCAAIGCTDEGKKNYAAEHLASAIGTSEDQVGIYSLITMVLSVSMIALLSKKKHTSRKRCAEHGRRPQVLTTQLGLLVFILRLK